MATKITVKLGDRSYPIFVGEKALLRLPVEAKKIKHGNRLFVIYDAQLYALHGAAIARTLKSTGLPVADLVIPPGEKSKSRASVNRIHDFLLGHGISRSDMVVAVGGGVISDLVGFAAASVLRGVQWGIVSTTLLGMVDAAIGGKTGINHRTGKNLIGAFWQPRFVLCDTSFLHTLSVRHMVAGLGEVVKYAGLVGQEMTKRVESYVKRGDLYDQRLIAPIVRASVVCKADIVARDENDSGVRRRLNLGHTFGHAIEASLGYGKLLHGEAVIIGLAAAVELSILTKISDERKTGRFAELIIECMRMLPKRTIDLDSTFTAMRMDKKRTGTGLNFVLLERPGKPLIRTGIHLSQVRTALSRAIDLYELHGGSNVTATVR